MVVLGGHRPLSLGGHVEYRVNKNALFLHANPRPDANSGYVHTGPVPKGFDPILERTISVHTAPFRLSTLGHTGPVCYGSVLNRSKKSSCFYQLSMHRIHVETFKMAPKKAESIEEGDKAFSWTGDESSLLLKVIIDYKAHQASKGKDWETAKRKHEDIIERFLKRFPSEISDASQVAEYPNGRDKSVFTINSTSTQA